VKDVTCVYVGGESEWPTYQSIGDQTEGVTVTFDKTQTSFEELLDFFYKRHNPHSACGYGRQYMSGVWWHNKDQELAVEGKVKQLEEASGQTVKTYCGPVTPLYRAEEYHQQYYAKMGGNRW